MDNECDVAVVGGGPASSALSTLLARWGRHVTVLEKEEFPRYHVGESLLPASWQAFERLGVAQAIREEPFVPKPGGTFIWGRDREPWTIYFGEIEGLAMARQVERARFDELLLDNAAQAGVDVRQGARAERVHFEDGRAVGVSYRGADDARRDLAARFVVDASGQHKLLGRQLDMVRYHPDFRNVAIWSYWEGVDWLPGYDAGNITYVTFDDGWVWYIPLDAETHRTSVGIVIRESGQRELQRLGPEAYYHAVLSQVEHVPTMLAGGTQVDQVRSIKDYAYRCDRFAGPGWIAVGDAACFVDPILSSGVFLALQYGMLGAYSVNGALTGDQPEERYLESYESAYVKQYDVLTRLCWNMYQTMDSKEGYFAKAQEIVNEEDAQLGKGATGPVAGRQAFIGLVSGLDVDDVGATVAAYQQRKGAASGEAASMASSEDVLNVVMDRAHLQALREERRARGVDGLGDEAVLQVAPGAEERTEMFLPLDPQAKALQPRAAVANAHGDRFAPTPALVTLLEIAMERPTYSKAVKQMHERISPELDEEELRAWLELLADFRLLEWHEPEGARA